MDRLSVHSNDIREEKKFAALILIFVRKENMIDETDKFCVNVEQDLLAFK